ncbi:MAG: thioredoxin-disulfide reductase [Nitrospirae bacterium RBG_19FT_COMBO_42_15]|nr:MAG: thioredoxin-disulfide reductase [Nitrospirae bacterium RBG_19FT_COMBO_42_15]
MKKEYDIIIIGGGPAGLTAGLYTSRARLDTLLIERALIGGQIVTTDKVENYPGFEQGISGPELARQMEAQAKRFGLEITSGRVVSAEDKGDSKSVRLEDGNEYICKAIIVASGAEPSKLEVEGEDKYRGRGVSYCATCDGAFFKNLKIAVIGGGDSAIEEALFLTKFASDVYVVHRRNELRATKILQERLFANPKIKMIWDSVVEKIEGDDFIKGVLLKNVKTQKKNLLNVDGIFIYVGTRPNTEFLPNSVKLNEKGYIMTDDNMSASVPGIFAAGDIRAKLLKQVSTAVGDGATAAFAAERFIEGLSKQ